MTGDLWCLHTVESLREEAADDNQIKQLAAERSASKWFIKYSFIHCVLKHYYCFRLISHSLGIPPEA